CVILGRAVPVLLDCFENRRGPADGERWLGRGQDSLESRYAEEAAVDVPGLEGAIRVGDQRIAGEEWHGLLSWPEVARRTRAENEGGGMGLMDGAIKAARDGGRMPAAGVFEGAGADLPVRGSTAGIDAEADGGHIHRVCSEREMDVAVEQPQD